MKLPVFHLFVNFLSMPEHSSQRAVRARAATTHIRKWLTGIIVDDRAVKAVNYSGSVEI